MAKSTSPSTSSAPRPKPSQPRPAPEKPIVYQGTIRHPSTQGSTTFGRPGPKAK